MRRFMLTLPLLFGVGEVPRLSDPVAQLAHAREKKQAMIGLEGEARSRARGEAVEAYRAVREHHPRARRVVAEAAFRAGELLRAGEDPESARAEFLVAVSEGRGTEFRARAWLEIGHLDRRARAHDRALASYLAVLADDDACAHHRDAALLWTGRVESDRGDREAARRAWERVAQSAEDPVDRVTAFDELGSSWLARGDAEAASGELARCQAALADVAREQTETGARVRAAMESMKTRKLLREIARRRVERARQREQRRREPPGDVITSRKKSL